MASRIAEIEIRLVESATWSVEARCESFRRFFISFNRFGLPHAREREASFMIEAKSEQCRVFSTPNCGQGFSDKFGHGSCVILRDFAIQQIL